VNRRTINRGIQRELEGVTELGLLEPAQRARIAELYPATPWNILVLARWFTILGATTMGAGVLVLARHLGTPVRLAEVGCTAAFAALLAASPVLGRRGLGRTRASAELMAGFALQGLVVALALDFSTGSDNWPAAVGLSTALLVPLAYVIGNRLVLIHALVNFFVWFGGETGYVSGWGAYWLGMTYPVRFLGIGLVSLGVAHAHALYLSGQRQAFARVYFHFGLLILNLSLWFLSVFGVYDEHVQWDGTDGQRVVFSFVWGLVSIAGLHLAGRLGQRALRSYALVFLVIDVYTFYFQFIAYHSAEAWFLHLLIAGGSLVAVGSRLEKALRAGQVNPAPSTRV
jgi:hypothetical protein